MPKKHKGLPPGIPSQHLVTYERLRKTGDTLIPYPSLLVVFRGLCAVLDDFNNISGATVMA